MKKKEVTRIVAVLMTGIMMAGSLTGCGNNTSDVASQEAYKTGDVASAASEETAEACGESDGDEYRQAAGSTDDYAPSVERGAAADASASVVCEESLADMASAKQAQKNEFTGYECDYAEECYVEPYDYDPYYCDPSYGERYEEVQEKGFSIVQSEPLSTFSADVDTASYANVRRMIEDGYQPEEIARDAVRAEEFINYFTYDLEKPKLGDKFGITTQLTTCPWNEEHELMMVGMRTKDIDVSKRPSSNLVFLLDVSGSMDEDNKLPLLQKSFLQLVDNLGKHDRVSIVTYASGVEVVLKNARGDEKEKIKQAIESLYASGGTNGEGGIQLAYKLAESNFIKNGNNRVILATDGDLNIGISEPDELERLIGAKKESGVFLSVLGFGDGNIRDDNMERLADKGNGNYAYIDSLFEAKKVLVEEMGATLNTVAKDVKLQVEFNPAKVSEYRLIGYENRMMAAQDFYDDTKDAGEIGAGHQVVALYELIPVGAKSDIKLKYGSQTSGTAKSDDGKYSNEYATVKVAYKQPNSSSSEMQSKVVTVRDRVPENEKNIHFAAMVAEYAMLLADSDYKGSASFEGIIEQYNALQDQSAFWDEYKNEFYYLVKTMCKRA